MADLPARQWRDTVRLIDLVLETAYHLLTQVGDQSVRTYLCRTLGWSRRRYSNVFTNAERNKIEKNQITGCTLLSKLLRQICGLANDNDPAWNTPETLEYNLASCKRKRNDIVDSAGNISEELRQKVKELLVKTLSMLESRTGRELSSLKDQVMVDYCSESLSEWELYYPLMVRSVTTAFKITLNHYNTHNQRLDELCFSSLKMKPGHFTKAEREQIRSNELDNLNLTTTYKVLQKLIPQDDRASQLVSMLKYMQNEAVHKYSQSYRTKYALDVLNSALELFSEYGLKQEDNSMMIQMGEQLFHNTYSLTPSFLSTVPSPSSLLSSPSLSPSSSSSLSSSSSCVASPPSVPVSTAPSVSTSTRPCSTGPQNVTVTNSTRFTLSQVNVVRAFVALCRNGPTAKVFARAFEELCSVPLTDVYSYCKDTLNYTRKQLSTFTDADVRLMQDKNTKVYDLDVTLLYKLLGHVCGLAKQSEWRRQPLNSLDHNLYLVKGARNFLAHEATHYTDNDLKQLLGVDLPQRLETILQKLEERCKTVLGRAVDLSQIVADIKKDLKQIHCDELPDASIKSYHQLILFKRKALAEKILAQSIKENKIRFSSDRLRVVNPFSWFYHQSHTKWDIFQLYTDLEMTSAMSSQGTGRVLTYNILTLIQNSANILIVEGVGGSGKTSLCKFVIQCSRSETGKMDGLVNVDILIFIQCRHIHCETLVEFLTQEELRETCKDVADEDVLRSLYDARLLFLVDGYDEAGPHARRIVEEALCKFPSSAFIITTRPEFKMDITRVVFESVGSQRTQFLRIHGFEESKREEYVINLFSTLGAAPQYFLEHLKTLDKHMGSFTQLPLTIALMGAAWIDDSDMIGDATTVTKIYEVIVKFFQKKMAERQCKLLTATHNDSEVGFAAFVTNLVKFVGLFIWNLVSRPLNTRPLQVPVYHIKDIERNHDEWLKTLAKIAWNNLQLNKMSLTDEDENLLRKKSCFYNLEPTNALSCLLQCQTMTTQVGSHENWEFIHKTVQEFLAANYLSQEAIEKNASVQSVFQLPQRRKRIEEYSQVLIFFAGLVAEKHEMTKLRAQQVLDLVHFQSPWTFSCITSLFRECKSSADFVSVLQGMFRTAFLLDYLDGYEPDSLHCVLKETALQVCNKLTIKITGADSDKMSPLIDLLASRGCHPHIIVPGDSPQDVNIIIQNLQDHHPKTRIIFSCTRSDSFLTLIQHWSWPKSLHLEFHPAVFPLLALEFVACMMSRSVSCSCITYTGNTVGNKEAMRKLAGVIGTDYQTSQNCANEAIIIEQ